jgi:hypothetical protein
MKQLLPQIPNWLLPFVGIPVGMVFWCLVVASISFIGGWHALAKSYRREESMFRIAGANEGEQFRWASLSMGPPFFPTNYGNCVTVFVGELGIGLQVMPLLRMLHPPLLIPWDAIEKCELDKEMLIFSRVKVEVGVLPHALRIYGRAAQAIESAWQRLHPYSAAVESPTVE